jgi:2-hydroxycyclohexanecarboxyl-CoA dehydrogenase
MSSRAVLITGCSSGIGAATGAHLVEKGWTVYATARRVETLADLEAKGCRTLALDVTDEASCRAAVEAVEAAVGAVDVLVNNAGTDRFAFFVHTDEELWDFVLGVNLRGTIAVTHALLGGMQERGRGAIVNVASEAGRVGSQGSVIYSAAKGGVISFTRAVAREAARYGVRVNAVAPGPIETPLLNSAAEIYGEIGARLKQGMIDATVLGRIGEPEEVAAAIAFLAGPDASYVTGQTVNVSGGLSFA